METELFKIDSSKPEEGKIDKAARLIEAGGFAAFPTETVYGIGSRVAAETLRKLNEIKGRSVGKYYTLHIGKKSEVVKYVPCLGLKAEKLIENCWPGPLTIVFELDQKDIRKAKERLESQVFDSLYNDNTIGIRCPDNKIAAMLLSEVRCPVVAPSANLTGREPAVSAAQVLSYFSGKIDLVLEGAGCQYNKSSTVVKVRAGKLELLREGVLSLEELVQASGVQVLFVCTGNTCRSPMAEGMFKKFLSEKLDCEVDELPEMGYKILSAGIMNTSGIPASDSSVSVCAGQGIDISGHKNRALSKGLISESDLIFGLSWEHCQRVLQISPEASDKCMLLAEDKSIPDPIGQSDEVYELCAKQIDEVIRKRINEIKL